MHLSYVEGVVERSDVCLVVHCAEAGGVEGGLVVIVIAYNVECRALETFGDVKIVVVCSQIVIHEVAEVYGIAVTVHPASERLCIGNH